ncbi:MAG: hypothetical protein EOQ47_32580 [Mesorhizobium sp.]|nr:MAG: hypothetical protein EOQ47_32580 [Mesorhizobium sp.]
MSRRLSPIASVVRLSGALKLPISPLVGEMSDRTEGGAKDHHRSQPCAATFLNRVAAASLRFLLCLLRLPLVRIDRLRAVPATARNAILRKWRLGYCRYKRKTRRLPAGFDFSQTLLIRTSAGSGGDRRRCSSCWQRSSCRNR